MADRQREIGACAIDVIDVLDDPGAALRDGIYATPTIMRLTPGPARRIFGRIVVDEECVNNRTPAELVPRTSRTAPKRRAAS